MEPSAWMKSDAALPDAMLSKGLYILAQLPCQDYSGLLPRD